MAGVHFRKKLIHLCTVQRTTPVQSGSGELIDAWADVGGRRACRYVQKTERVADAAAGFPLLKTDMLLMNDGEDVIEADRITAIEFADGTAVDAGPFGVEALLERNTRGAHHISLTLERAG